MIEAPQRAGPESLDILYVGTLPPHPGGSAVMCGQLLLGLSGMGHRIRALAPLSEDALSAPDSFPAAFPNFTVTRFVVRRNMTTPDFLHGLFQEGMQFEQTRVRELLPSLISAGPADVIILGREPCLWYFRDLRRDLSVPAVLIAHGLISYRLTMGRYPETLSQEILHRLRQPARIVTPGMHLAERLRAAQTSPVSVIPNPVNTALFAPRPKDPALLRALSLSAEDMVVAHVSNLKSVKRPLDVVASAEMALRRNPRLIYVVVGEGEHRADMEDLCRQKGILGRFRFTGWVTHEAVPGYLNLADIVVMPSEIETQALVYLETQACGRLLLASDIPGAREVVEQGRNGLLFRMGDLEDLTRKTLRAAENPQLREELGRNARQSVQAHSLERVVSAYHALLREVAGQPQGKTR